MPWLPPLHVLPHQLALLAALLPPLHVLHRQLTLLPAMLPPLPLVSSLLLLLFTRPDTASATMEALLPPMLPRPPRRVGDRQLGGREPVSRLLR